MESDPPERADLLTQLRATLGRVELAFSLVADAIVWTDGEGRIQWCNASFDAFAGRPHIEVLGAELIDLLPLQSRGQLLPSDRHPVILVLGSQPNLAGRYEFIKADRTLALEISAKRATVGQDGPTAVFVIHDVTERVRSEEATLKLNARLETTNRELEAFSYSVSHDLRGPLRSIDGFSQALLEDYADRLDARGKDYLRRVRAGAQRMAQLIDDLLQLSRVTRADLRHEEVDLSSLARTIAAELQQSAPERRVEFLIQGGLVVHGDARLLRLALENLLGNAWKFTSKITPARIELGATEEPGGQVFFVRDNGAGFDMAYVDKLFGAFQRLHRTTDFPGTGIGLATVERIIRRHGGRVWARGAVGEGAAFYFMLPRIEGATAALASI